MSQLRNPNFNRRQADKEYAMGASHFPAVDAKAQILRQWYIKAQLYFHSGEREELPYLATEIEGWNMGISAAKYVKKHNLETAAVGVVDAFKEPKGAIYYA